MTDAKTEIRKRTLWQWLADFSDAMDATPYDGLQARVVELEREITALKTNRPGTHR